MDNERVPHSKDGPIKLTKGYRKYKIFKKTWLLFWLLVIGILFASIIYVFLRQPVKSNNGYLTAEPIYKIAELGEKVVVVEGKETTPIITPIKRSIIIQNAYKAKIVAGPYGEIKKVNGGYRVDDGTNAISVNLQKPKKYLEMEYVVRKIDENGDYIKDEKDVIINKNELLGKVEMTEKIK